jgi:hypothetical protein
VILAAFNLALMDRTSFSLLAAEIFRHNVPAGSAREVDQLRNIISKEKREAANLCVSALTMLVTSLFFSQRSTDVERLS